MRKAPIIGEKIGFTIRERSRRLGEMEIGVIEVADFRNELRDLKGSSLVNLG